MNIDDNNFDIFLPEALMLREELQEAKRLIKKSRNAYDRLQALEEIKPINEKKRESLKVMRGQLDDALKDICERVLKRECGLEKFMVVRIYRHRSDTPTIMQILDISLTDNFGGLRFAWDIEGRSLRKDGTLGQMREMICFNFARIEFRRLDGVWERLPGKVFAE